MRNKRFNEDQT